MIHPLKHELKKHRLCQNRSDFYNLIKDSQAKRLPLLLKLKLTPQSQVQISPISQAQRLHGNEAAAGIKGALAGIQ